MINLDSRHSLFLDDFLIEDKVNVTRRINQPEKYENNPVLAPDLEHPWEGRVSGISVLYDEEEHLFKMWYNATNLVLSRPDQASPDYIYDTFICYATSKDGIQWKKPELEVQDYDYGFHWAYIHGKVKSYEEWAQNYRSSMTKKNNILLRSLKSECFDVGAVISDNKDPDPNRRYTLVSHFNYYHLNDKSKKNGIGLIFSPDGIHWRYSEDEPVDLQIYAGDRTTAFYDAGTKKYIVLTRPPKQIAKGSGRRVAMWVSGDLENWEEVGEILAADERDPERTELYSMYPFKYESMYIGFLEMYYVPQGIGETQLVCSRDGVHWKRVGRKPFLTWGLQESSRDVTKGFDSAWVFPVSSPPIRVGNRLYVWYSGRKTRHFFHPSGGIEAIGLATLRVDGYVSIDAGEDEGFLLTKPFTFSGKELHVNSKTEWRDARGMLKVEILNEDNEPIPGYEKAFCDGIRSDSIDTLVSWRRRSDIGSLAIRPIRIKFYLANTNLYSFWFE